MFDLDSDDDGCNDVVEAGYSDPNLDGLLGENPVLVDQNGKVTSGTDGYTTPIDQNNNNVQDYVDINWDVNCVNPGLSITKSANPIDINGDGLIQLNDQIVYTIIVTNTSEVSVTYTLSDTLSNEASQIILTPQLVWSSTSTNVAVLPPYNYIRKSSNFSVISSNSGASYNLESNYWHWDGSRRSNNLNYYYHDNSYRYNYIPALDETFIYYAGNSTGATPAQTGLTEGYTDSAGANTQGYKTHSGQNYFNQFIHFYQGASDPGSENEYTKTFKYIEIPNLEDNTQYTLSVFAFPRNSTDAAHMDYYSDGFNLIFHDDSNGKSWNNSSGNSYLNTNWTNAQKSERFYIVDYKVKRFSHTFTTGTGVGTTRVGINFPYMNGYGVLFYGMQLEKGSQMSPIYTYT
jgi:uncharacterized repeat protein (TIGR01451 family)